MNPMVIDASATMGFLLEDEKAAPSLKALTAIEQGALAYVPTHWWLEIANALLMAERRHRITQTTVTESLHALQVFPVITDDETVERCGAETLALARQYALTCYDAAYLELAIRYQSTLVTLDRALATAAKKVGISVLS